jgi:hypothetical protein
MKVAAIAYSEFRQLNAKVEFTQALLQSQLLIRQLTQLN